MDMEIRTLERGNLNVEFVISKLEFGNGYLTYDMWNMKFGIWKVKFGSRNVKGEIGGHIK